MFFFKKKKPFPELENTIKRLKIVDVIGFVDIPVMELNGIDQFMRGDIFFELVGGIPKHVRPWRINSHMPDIADAIFWIYDTFCVLELGTNRTLKNGLH